MTAYMIVYAAIHDKDKFQSYVEAVQPILEKYKAKLVARANPPLVFEGDWPWQTAGVLEFPSVDAARAMWDSPEYRAVKELRATASSFQVVVL